MTPMTLPVLQAEDTDEEVFRLLVEQGKMGQHEADYYLALLRGEEPGDIAYSSRSEIEAFMAAKEARDAGNNGKGRHE